MNPKRLEAQNFILTYIDKMLPGSQNNQFYQTLFETMDDVSFEQFMKDIRDGVKNLCIIAPNEVKPKLSVERNIKIAKELKYDFFQRIWIHGTGERPTYLTPIPYMVLKLPLRRQGQLLVKKISIPEDNRSIDDLTGQPTGKSKGSKISSPETHVMAANNLTECLNEFMKYRGGDVKGFDAMNKTISRYGAVSLKSIEPYASGVESTKTMKTLLTSMHLKSTL